VVTPIIQQAARIRLVAHLFNRRGTTRPNLPVLLYGHPGRAGVPIRTETMIQLAEHQKIVRVKRTAQQGTRFLRLRKVAKVMPRHRHCVSTQGGRCLKPFALDVTIGAGGLHQRDRPMSSATGSPRMNRCLPGGPERSQRNRGINASYLTWSRGL